MEKEALEAAGENDVPGLKAYLMQNKHVDCDAEVRVDVFIMLDRDIIYHHHHLQHHHYTIIL